jgi:acetyl-CoA carboxylase biotin carboxyl carrier protein
MSTARALIALTEESPEHGRKERPGKGAGEARILSPAVGLLQNLPAIDTELSTGISFASIRIIGRNHPLLLPDGLGGLVTAVDVPGHGADLIPVAYGQPIITLLPDGAARTRSKTGSGNKKSHGGTGEKLPPGTHAVVAPADGVFYRRPRPGDPPYAEPGSRISRGQTLALIEAMKCFSAIIYEGPGLPDPAEVVEVRGNDGDEVRHGQVLFVVKSL